MPFIIRSLIVIGMLASVSVTDVLADSEACTGISSTSVLCEFLTTVDSYSAEFTQVLVDEQGELLEESAGQLWLEKPGRFRWHYAEPWERLIVANETSVWLYDAELEQVTLRAADGAIEQTPAGLLAGNTAALADFSITTVNGTEGLSVVTLVPLTDSGDFREMILSFTAGELASLSLQDRFGQRTVITLHKVDRNPVLAAELFNFIIPEGVDVINQTTN